MSSFLESNGDVWKIEEEELKEITRKFREILKPYEVKIKAEFKKSALLSWDRDTGIHRFF